MPLTPPGDLAGFPSRSLGTRGLETVYRVYAARRPDGTVTRPWWFSSGDGRFDLARPQGTCYWSDRKYGAWVEVFRGARTIDPVDARRRRLASARPPRLRMANLIGKAAYAFGITTEISSSPSYDLPQQWAAALRAKGFAGLLGSCRHDPSARARNVAVFGKAGSPSRQPGWHVASSALEDDLTLLTELARLGVHVAPIPYDVPTL